MKTLRSWRILAVVALLATIVMAFAPFSAVMRVGSSKDQGFMQSSLDGSVTCKPCPKANMALTSCQQITCQLAPDTSYIHFVATAPLRYAPVTMTRPAEWHTVPPVSPG